MYDAICVSQQIGGCELDLVKFSQIVAQQGGLKTITSKQKWNKVADQLKLPKMVSLLSVPDYSRVHTPLIGRVSKGGIIWSYNPKYYIYRIYSNKRPGASTFIYTLHLKHQFSTKFVFSMMKKYILSI